MALWHCPRSAIPRARLRSLTGRSAPTRKERQSPMQLRILALATALLGAVAVPPSFAQGSAKQQQQQAKRDLKAQQKAEEDAEKRQELLAEFQPQAGPLRRGHAGPQVLGLPRRGLTSARSARAWFLRKPRRPPPSRSGSCRTSTRTRPHSRTGGSTSRPGCWPTWITRPSSPWCWGTRSAT